VTFYVGLKVGHDLRWADAGSSMAINWDQIQLWLIFAVPAGAILGLLGSRAPHPSWQGAAASAALLGVLLGEAYRRYTGYGPDIAVGVALLLAAALYVVTVRRNRQPVLTLVFTALASVAGLLLVSAPDLVEQLLVRGS
jgi:hypothetical protein